jgi:hypothetical protein
MGQGVRGVEFVLGDLLRLAGGDEEEVDSMVGCSGGGCGGCGGGDGCDGDDGGDGYDGCDGCDGGGGCGGDGGDGFCDDSHDGGDDYDAEDINNNHITHVPLTLLPAADVAFLHNQHHCSALGLGRSLCGLLDFR